MIVSAVPAEFIYMVRGATSIVETITDGEDRMIYLDNSATTCTLDEAAETAKRYMCVNFFNPSSAYLPAVEAERDVEAARARLAGSLGASPEEIIYTSGGTESNNTAIYGILNAQRKGRLICGSVEHPSVYEVFRALQQKGADTIYVPVNGDGTVSIEYLKSVLRPDTVLVSVMHINNETGAVNDLGAIYRLVKKHAPGAAFHADGVQAFCKTPFAKPECDLYSISGHKFHGPKGIGALYIRKGTRFTGGQIGGGQERNLRSGTTNTPGIMGMDTALSFYREYQTEIIPKMRSCKMRLAKNLMDIDEAIINGPMPDEGAPHILNVSFLGVRGEVLLHALEQQKIYVSTGSACSAHKKGKNRILESMGIGGTRQEGAVRFSLCPFNTLDEMDRASEAIADQVKYLRKFKRR
jgi:cysteine desulfurase